MDKFASIIDEIAKAAQEQRTKIAQDSLSNSKTPPTISSDLGILMLKTAALLKNAKSEEVTHQDLRDFMERIRNA